MVQQNAATNVPPAAIALLLLCPEQLTGDLAVGTVLTMLPYANAVSIFTVKGSVLIAAVKNGLSAFPSGGRFLQVTLLCQALAVWLS